MIIACRATPNGDDNMRELLKLSSKGSIQSTTNPGRKWIFGEGKYSEEAIDSAAVITEVVKRPQQPTVAGEVKKRKWAGENWAAEDVSAVSRLVGV